MEDRNKLKKGIEQEITKMRIKILRELPYDMAEHHGPFGGLYSRKYLQVLLKRTSKYILNQPAIHTSSRDAFEKIVRPLRSLPLPGQRGFPETSKENKKYTDVSSGTNL